MQDADARESNSMMAVQRSFEALPRCRGLNIANFDAKLFQSILVMAILPGLQCCCSLVLVLIVLIQCEFQLGGRSVWSGKHEMSGHKVTWPQSVWKSQMSPLVGVHTVEQKPTHTYTKYFRKSWKFWTSEILALDALFKAGDHCWVMVRKVRTMILSRDFNTSWLCWCLSRDLSQLFMKTNTHTH